MAVELSAVDVVFQSTHPVWGETRGDGGKSAAEPDFNPLTPCGVRLAQKNAEVDIEIISIHSPRVG